MNEGSRFSASASGESNDQFMISAFIMQQQQQQVQHHDQFNTGSYLNCDYASASHGGPMGSSAVRLQSSGDHQYGAHEGVSNGAAASTGGSFSVIGGSISAHGGSIPTSQAHGGGIPAHHGGGVPTRVPASGGSFLASQNGVIPGTRAGFPANGGSVSVHAGSVPASGGVIPAPPSRYESQKRRDWNTFGQYLRNSRPPLPLARCNGEHVLQFLRYLDQFGKTKVHATRCPYFGLPHPPGPCECPLRQAWGSLDALIGRLRAAFEEHGGKPESNPFGARAVRMYLREVRELQAKARGIAYEKKKRKRPKPPMGASSISTGTPPNYHSEPPAPASTSGFLISGCN